MVRIRLIVQETVVRKRATGKQDEMEAKRKEGNVEVAARLEVAVHMHLWHRQ